MARRQRPFFRKKISLKPLISGIFFRIGFYHTKKCEGTITMTVFTRHPVRFYHTKKCEGTITFGRRESGCHAFYHTKKCEGTITTLSVGFKFNLVLPYQEMRGNYNEKLGEYHRPSVLPYQEMRGNYNTVRRSPCNTRVLPYQEMRGNYNLSILLVFSFSVLPYQEMRGNYNRLNMQWTLSARFTIPRNAREL